MSIKINNSIKESRVAVMPLNDGFVDGVGAYHLSNTPELYEVQRNNNFMFEVSLTTDANGNPTPLYRAGIDPVSESQNPFLKFGNPEEVIRLSVNKASIPSYSQDVITVARGNTSIRYAGKINFSENTSIKLYDFIGAQTKEILLAWQALSGNPYTERVGHASDYKKNAFLCEYTPDYQLVRRWQLFGCWIKELTLGDFQFEGSSDQIQIDATIVYDRAYVDVSGLSD